MAPLAHFHTNLFATTGIGSNVGVASGVSVQVFEIDEATPIGQTLYKDASGSVVLTNPFQADNLGNVEFYTDWPQTFAFTVSGTNVLTKTFRDDVSPFSGPP